MIQATVNIVKSIVPLHHHHIDVLVEEYRVGLRNVVQRIFMLQSNNHYLDKTKCSVVVVVSVAEARLVETEEIIRHT